MDQFGPLHWIVFVSRFDDRGRGRNGGGGVSLIKLWYKDVFIVFNSKDSINRNQTKKNLFFALRSSQKILIVQTESSIYKIGIHFCKYFDQIVTRLSYFNVLEFNVNKILIAIQYISSMNNVFFLHSGWIFVLMFEFLKMTINLT